MTQTTEAFSRSDVMCILQAILHGTKGDSDHIKDALALRYGQNTEIREKQ